MPGVHHRDGIFIACGPGIDATLLPPLNLPEAGILVEALAGLSLSPSRAAQLPAFAQELAADLNASTAIEPNNEHRSPASPLPLASNDRLYAGHDGLSEAERHAISDRLRALGYID